MSRIIEQQLSFHSIDIQSQYPPKKIMQYPSILTDDGNKKKIKTKSSKAYPHIYFTLVSGAL